MGRNTFIWLCAVILICAACGCRRGQILQELYPSQVHYSAASLGKEVVLVTDSRDEVTIAAESMLILRVLGAHKPPHEIVIGFRQNNRDLRITGYDPRGVYAPFAFHGTFEQLFGADAGICVEADIMLVPVESQEAYSLEHLRINRTADHQ